MTIGFHACRDERPSTPDAAGMVYGRPMSALPDFSGDRCMELLIRQVDFGPRAPNTSAHDSCLRFFEQLLRPLADDVSLQSFQMTGYDGEVLRLTNVIARFNPGATQRVLLAAHWDSRPRADRETDPAVQPQPIPGANDGASGVAVLLHLAELFAAQPPSIGIDLVLFDGEDYGREGDEAMYCLGSKYFAATGALHPLPSFGILLDLVGDRDARFPQEGFSLRDAPGIVRLVWGAAEELDIARFVTERYDPILDDHVFLTRSAGIPTINIIDASLVGHADPSPRRRYWHTMHDTPAQCAPETLADVGRVLLRVIYGHRPA